MTRVSGLSRGARGSALIGAAVLLATAACGGDEAAEEAAPPPPRIAFACAQPSGLRQLEICVTDGVETKRLTDSDSNDLGPVWSPDGSMIAFQCRQTPPTFEEGFIVTSQLVAIGGAGAFPVHRESAGEICAVGAEGGDARQLTETKGKSAAPAWSPDGEEIVFARGVVMPVHAVEFGFQELSFLAPAKVHGLFTVPAAGGPMRRLTREAGDDLPAWSPDGQTIAFTTAKGGIAVVDATGTNRRALTRPSGAVDVGAAWSPDGTMIAFTRYPLTQYRSGDSTYVGAERREVWVMAADGSDQRPLTSSAVLNNTRGLVFRPEWSPNGRAVAVTTVRESSTSFWYQVTVVTVGDGSKRQLGPVASDPDQIGALLPSWSADGTRIAFLSDIGGDFEVYTSPVGGGTPRALTRDTAQQFDPAWAP